MEFAVVGEGYIAQLSNFIAAAQASFNLQAFLPDVVPPGTIGFLMDNLYFSYEKSGMGDDRVGEDEED